MSLVESDSISIRTFLHQTYDGFQAGLNPTQCILVLGNESFDLDSCVSTLLLARSLCRSQTKIPLPIMNCHRADFRLRPDIVLILRRIAIDSSFLLCIDDLSPEFLSNIGSIALVDHNRLSIKQEWLSPYVQMIFDHHRDEGGFLHANPRHVQTCASAATVVAIHAFDANQFQDADLAFLILSTIVADSNNFCPILKRITDSDRHVLQRISASTKHIDRDQLHEAIRSARSDVGSLTTLELLRRDLKIVEKGGIRIAISVIPEPISKWHKRDPSCNAEKEGRREIAIIHDDGGRNLALDFQQSLLGHDELGLMPLPEFNDCNTRVFHQQNLQYTRKAMIPIVQEWLINQQECL